MALSVSVIRHIDELRALTPAWRELLARSAQNEHTLTPLWLTTWWDVFGPGRQLCTLALHDGSRLVGLAPLLRRRFRPHPQLPASWRVELLASGEDEADELCSPYLGLVAERGNEQAVAEATVAALTHGELGSWDEICLTQLSLADPVLAPLVNALRRRRVFPTVRRARSSAYVDLPASFDDYLARLSGSRRYFVRRTLRDFGKWAGPGWRLRVVTDPTELESAQETLYALHEERWQADGESGVFRSDRFRGFHEHIMRAMLATPDGPDGRLELSLLERGDGTPLAALYNIVHAGSVFFHQAGRRVDTPKKVRLGIASHLVAIQRAIEQGMRHYDFLAARHRYKQQLATDVRTQLTLSAVSPAWSAQLLDLTRKSLIFAGRRWRSWRQA